MKKITMLTDDGIEITWTPERVYIHSGGSEFYATEKEITDLLKKNLSRRNFPRSGTCYSKMPCPDTDPIECFEMQNNPNGAMWRRGMKCQCLCHYTG